MLCTHIAVAQLAGGKTGVFDGEFRPLGEIFIAFDKAYPP